MVNHLASIARVMNPGSMCELEIFDPSQAPAASTGLVGENTTCRAWLDS